MTESAVRLDAPDRQLVADAIRGTCDFRGWMVHALNVRSNHAHAVITADGLDAGEVLRIIKAYGCRALNRCYPDLGRKHWWAQGGSKRYINDVKSLGAAVEYVETQDDSDYHGVPREGP